MAPSELLEFLELASCTTFKVVPVVLFTWFWLGLAGILFVAARRLVAAQSARDPVETKKTHRKREKNDHHSVRSVKHGEQQKHAADLHKKLKARKYFDKCYENGVPENYVSRSRRYVAKGAPQNRRSDKPGPPSKAPLELPKNITVTIHDASSGKDYLVEVSKDADVRDIKLAALLQHGLDLGEYHLILGDRELQDFRSLGWYGVEVGSMLNLREKTKAELADCWPVQRSPRRWPDPRDDGTNEPPRVWPRAGH
jgi:hypothetical protein